MRPPSKAKLSPFMLRALRAIVQSGGRAIAQGGGYWAGETGSRLKVEPSPEACGDYVGTQTIYALEARGCLIRENEDRRAWKDSRAVTALGREKAFQLLDSAEPF